MIASNLKKRVGIILTALALFACSNDDDQPQNTDDAHSHADEHQSFIVMSQENSSVLMSYSQASDSFTEVMNLSQPKASLLRSVSGQSALVNVDDNVSFVALSESQSHDLTLNVSEFTTTSTTSAATGHAFSLLTAAGSSGMLEIEHVLETSAFDSEFNAVVQNYPAHLLDEHGEYMLVFSGGNATVYENSGTQENPSYSATSHSAVCSMPKAVWQLSHLTVMDCNGSLQFLLLEEEQGSHHFDFGLVDISEIPASNSVQWQAAGHHLYGFTPSLPEMFQLHIEENAGAHEVHAESLALFDHDVAITFTQGVCGFTENTADSDGVFILTNEAQVWAFSVESHDEHDGHDHEEHDHEEHSELELVSRLRLDDSAQTLACDRQVWSGASNMLAIADNDAAILYLIDAHEGPFHIEHREALNFHVYDMSVLHEISDDEHDHEEHEDHH